MNSQEQVMVNVLKTNAGKQIKTFGQTEERKSDDVGKRMLRMEKPGKRPRGRPKS